MQLFFLGFGVDVTLLTLNKLAISSDTEDVLVSVSLGFSISITSLITSISYPLAYTLPFSIFRHANLSEGVSPCFVVSPSKKAPLLPNLSFKDS